MACLFFNGMILFRLSRKRRDPKRNDDTIIHVGLPFEETIKELKSKNESTLKNRTTKADDLNHATLPNRFVFDT